MFGFQIITDFDHQRVELERGRYGMIEVRGGKLVAIHLRPLPKLVSIWQALIAGRKFHATRTGDVCYLYYNQPRGYSKFFALKYAVSSHDCTMATINAALVVLDEIARIKRIDAVLCDAANLRFNARMLSRYGWEPHAKSRWNNNYIKRFYGVYPRYFRVNEILNRPIKEKLPATIVERSAQVPMLSS